MDATDDLTAEQVADLIADPEPWGFFEYLWIEHRATNQMVRFNKRGAEQDDWIRALMTNTRATDLKGRNVGIGVATQAFHFWRAWRAAWHGYGIKTLVVAHAEDTAKRHLQRYKDFNARLPEALRLDIATTSGGDNATDYKLVVPKDDGSPAEFAWFRAVTAAGKKGKGRGFTQQQLHLTEVAFWDEGGGVDVDGIVGSLTSAMHASEYKSIAIETTPRGLEGAFPAIYGEAKDHPEPGVSIARFYPWTMQSSFRTTPKPGFERTPDEDRMCAVWDRFCDANVEMATSLGLRPLDDDQLQWRRDKIREVRTVEKFQADYPLTEEEAFRTGGTGWFTPESLAPRLHEIMERARAAQPFGKIVWPKGERIYAEPRPDRVYAVAVDVAAGVGKDDSVIQVIDNTFEQVACYSSNEVRPDEIGDIAVTLARWYNNATLMVESNNIGAETVYRVKELGYPLAARTLWGNKSHNNRDEVFGYVKLQIDRGRVRMVDYHTVRDMLAMTVANRRTNHSKGGHNDHATAMIYAIWMAQKLTSIDTLRARAVAKRFHAARPAVLSRW
jgi:hypothetical protein